MAPKRNEINDDKLVKLRDNLTVIRQAGGWSHAQFAEMVGLTKQTIINLEKGESSLSKSQYIAIRTVLEYEIENNKEEFVADLLDSLLYTLVDKDGSSQKDMDGIKNAVAYTYGAKKAKMSPDAIAAGLSLILGATAFVIGLAATKPRTTRKAFDIAGELAGNAFEYWLDAIMRS